MSQREPLPDQLERGCACGHKLMFCHKVNAARYCPADTQAEADVRQATALLDLSRVPNASYEGQGGGVCKWTFAGRVDHLLRLLERHGIPVDEGVYATAEDLIRAASDESQRGMEAGDGNH